MYSLISWFVLKKMNIVIEFTHRYFKISTLGICGFKSFGILSLSYVIRIVHRFLDSPYWDCWYCVVPNYVLSEQVGE